MASKELLDLVKRFEDVALKLETISGSGISANIGSAIETIRNETSSKNLNLQSLNQVIESLEKRVESPSGPTSASLSEFDSILSSSFTNYVNLSRKIGGDVETQSKMVEGAVSAQKAFLTMAVKSKKPSDNDLMMLLKPTSDKISEIQSFREANRRSEYFNHLSSISESIPALGWVTVSPAPYPFVKEMNDAGQFYTNRVLKDFKEKSKMHVEWVAAWIKFLAELQAFVKEHHTTGLTWNPKGVDAKASAGPPAAPLPPPPPPPGLFDDIKNGTSNQNSKRNALLDELNRGEDVTKGLKKVTADMQTHKNPELRGSAKPAPTSKPAPASAKKPVVAQQKPPKFELDGKKWMVEFQNDNHNLSVKDTEVNQSVYVYKCTNCTLKVEGKVNNIILDGCKKTAVLFDSVVSSCEFINCQSVKMQVMGSVPTISVEKTDGCQMYLSQTAKQASIISAKSSEMNVLIPTGDEFVEQPIPEQFKTSIVGTKLVTAATDSV